MTTITEIEDALHAYATATTGKQWIHTTGAEAPKYAYGEIKLLTLEQNGTHGGQQGEVLADDFKESVTALFRCTYQFMFIGDGARQTVLDMVNKSNLQTHTNKLKEDGVGFESFGGLTDLTGLDFDKVRERVVVEMRFNAVLTIEDTVPFIKTAEVEQAKTEDV